MRERVRKLHAEGLTQKEIADRLGVAKTTVNFHVRRLDIPVDGRFAKRYDWKAISAGYERGLSMRQCMKKFGFSSHAWYAAIKRGDVEPRPTAMPIEELLVVGRRTSRTHLKNRLLKEGLKENRCEICGITTWMGKPVNMQLHHVNGDGSDNRLKNIQFLCGNCHSQTDTYGGRNGHRRPERHLELVEPPPDENDSDADEDVA
jgi:transcriptional regulator with XRE-family HTH domain